MNRLKSLLTAFLLMAGIAGSAAGMPTMSIMGDTTPIGWDTSAGGFQGATGRTYRFSCPSDGTAQPIYGSDIYTDDSSICTAAVHAGLISIERGGVVSIEIRPGRSTYGSTTRHGIKSNNFGEYHRSFVFNSSGASQAGHSTSGRNARPDADNDESGEVTPIGWDTSAGGFKGETGQTYRFSCPAAGTTQAIWGSDVYTDDSSICTAAVHAGAITRAQGGVVTIEIRPGRSTYGSTLRHGIKSNNFGEYGRSFVVR
ncbi:MAG: LCCL domain-containing protein [Pyrinomonadaceae bacterium]